MLLTIIILFIPLVLAILLLYRSSISWSDMTILNGKVINKRISKETSLQGNTHYSLVFTIENGKRPISLFLGSTKSSKKNKIVRLIDTGKFYKFYLDPTIISLNGIQSGIRRIDDNGKLIFIESNNFNFFGGLSFMFFSIFGFGIIWNFGINKNTN